MSLKIIAIVSIALATLAGAVPFRAVGCNIGDHFTGSAPDYSLGDPGTPDYETVKAILARIDADVVALQEIASADVSTASGPSDLSVLAASLGYSHVYVASTSSAPPLTGPFDTSLRVAFLSRYPFLSTAVIRSPVGARELSRLLPVVRVDIPGTTRDPLLIAAHLKSGTAQSDRFERAIAMKRLTGYLTSQGLTNDDNFMIMGDFNFSSSNTVYNALPASGLPASYDLGDDVTFPVTYSTNPVSYFSSPGITRIIPRQLNGSTVTFPTSGSTIDLIMVSPAFAGRPLATEIYNSAQDTSNSAGLPKAGLPLDAATSATASDHLPLFGDFELDADFPNLDLAINPSSVAEGSPDGTATLTVTLPEARATDVTVTLTSDDDAGSPVSSTLVIPAGSLGGSVDIRTPRNFIDEEQRSVTFTATANGYDPESAVLQVIDTDGPYTFTAAGQTVVETFDGFSGSMDPAPWVTTGYPWQGVENGFFTTAGFRAYGSVSESSLGLLPGTTPGTATATFVNQSAVTLSTVRISFTAEQWRAALGGSADTLSVELLQEGVATPLPALSFVAATDLPSGPVSGGSSTLKTAEVSGLSVAPGASFELRFTFAPGASGAPPPADIFINEFHYDNVSTDENEFIEVIVGPGFTGALSDIDIVLYNGENATNGVVYGTRNLATGFTLAGTFNGYRIFTTDYSGIQNGDRDGFAVFNKTTSQVLQFISYEGTFTAGAGPAAGMTSTNLPVSQSTPPAVGSSLGLTGTGGNRSDFTWAAFIGSNSKGAPNLNQTFATPVFPQGISIDNLSVTFIPDGPGDTDGDGSTDRDEWVFGTDPLDPASRFTPVFSRSSGSVGLTFPTVMGRTYVIESSDDLIVWEPGETYQGTGEPRVADITVSPSEPERFYRIRVVRP